ncbi:unnamed protein product [Allacma fusca]|uniref:MPN domain-containing protein n=1 Tax=Allacma fusca TaxID=39272 RepID=A0A8J2JEX5_9HEXA|nr:unnamed protein product [Allacma fusca]
MSSQMLKQNAAESPEVRMKRISDLASSVIMNTSVKATAYVRTGREMYRSANNYLDDGSTENAYILYMRFLTIFVDKIRSHPGFKDIPPLERQQLISNCREILPRTEELKKRLLEKYQVEHEEYLKRRKILEAQEEQERRRQEREAQRLKEQQDILQDNTPFMNPENQMYKYSPAEPSTSSFPNNHPYNSSVLSSLPEYNDLNLWEQNIPSGPASAPHYDRSNKPVRILSPNCSGLRQLLVPADIPKKFLALASSNTKRNCETCGILCGKIMREKLVITHMVIPKQSGTSDSCCMLNEEEILFIQDSANLITFGWIHTHPSQTAFLSSVDLHTQYSYQLMMPEAIAIVCSPSHNQTGIFQINPTAGMEIIGKCNESTVFHPHPETHVPLFHEPSHAVVDNTRTVIVQDLRYLSQWSRFNFRDGIWRRDFNYSVDITKIKIGTRIYRKWNNFERCQETTPPPPLAHIKGNGPKHVNQDRKNKK